MTAPVIVVDDEPMVRKSLARAIQRSGVEVVTAADGQEAFTRFRELRSPVIFTDVRMPNMDGLALLRSVKRIAPDTAVVLITGFASEDVIAQARADGASHVLSKPFTLGEVDEILAEVLGPVSAVPGEPPERGPVLLTESPRIEAILALARRVAATDATVMIDGETGSGKEVLARFIHAASRRAGGPFVAVNCSALPESLVEAELFGHERGAFTGALARRTGRFEAASRGTLLLDEITEVPLGLQAKLLRALQEREVERVGSSYPVKVDVRIVATTNQDLRTEVREGRFRSDLFYRLNVLSFHLPPLRARTEDIPLLARHFLEKYRAAHGGPATVLGAMAMDRLLAHSWPGNVRELENVIQRAAILCTREVVEADDIVIDDDEDLMPAGGPIVAPGRTVAEVERDLILATLDRLGGNRTHTARALGLSVRTIRNRLRDYRMTS